jgi:hypothetical protein
MKLSLAVSGSAPRPCDNEQFLPAGILLVWVSVVMATTFGCNGEDDEGAGERRSHLDSAPRKIIISVMDKPEYRQREITGRAAQRLANALTNPSVVHPAHFDCAPYVVFRLDDVYYGWPLPGTSSVFRFVDGTTEEYRHKLFDEMARARRELDKGATATASDELDAFVHVMEGGGGE